MKRRSRTMRQRIRKKIYKLGKRAKNRIEIFRKMRMKIKEMRTRMKV